MTDTAKILPQEPPQALARLLAVGGTGAGLIPARDAALAGGPGLSALADGLTRAGWEDMPFDPGAARLAAARLGSASPAGRLAGALAGAAQAVEPEPYFERLAARRDLAKMVAYLLERRKKAPGDAGVLARLATLAPMLAGGAGSLEIEAAFAGLDGNLAGPGAMAAGELALLDGRSGEAEVHLRRALAFLPTGAVRLRLAEALLAQGGRQAALAQFALARELRPFDGLLLARFADVLAGLDCRMPRCPGPWPCWSIVGTTRPIWPAAWTPWPPPTGLWPGERGWWSWTTAARGRRWPPSWPAPPTGSAGA